MLRPSSLATPRTHTWDTSSHISASQSGSDKAGPLAHCWSTNRRHAWRQRVLPGWIVRSENSDGSWGPNRSSFGPTRAARSVGRYRISCCNCGLGPIAVVVDGDHRAAFVDTLEGLGFVFEPAADMIVTVLDTFDGRLHRQGVRLTVQDCGTLEWELARGGIDTIGCSVLAVPTHAGEIVDPLLCSTIVESIGGRRLLVRLRFTASTTRGLSHSDEGEATAEIVFSEQIVVDVAGQQRHLASVVETRVVGGAAKSARRTIKAGRR